MSAVISGTHALSVLFGLNWDRILFVGAIVAALFIAASVISFQTASPTFI